MAIHFYVQDSKLILPNKRRLKSFINELFEKENMVLASLTYVFCTDSYLLSINQSYLAHDDFTDIITFSLGAPGLDSPVVGEIYISLERVKENAGFFGVSISHELHRVIFHGALHLCGFKDKTRKEKMKMTAKEDEYLGYYFNAHVPRNTVSE